jgi:hypothetical protein
MNFSTFTITPDSSFPVYADSRWTIRGGNIACLFGLICNYSLLLRIPSDVDGFKVCRLLHILFVTDWLQSEAIDDYGTYATFALQARVPAACSFLSLGLLTIFAMLTVLRDHHGTISLILALAITSETARYWSYGIHRGIGGFLEGLHAQYEKIREFIIAFAAL